MSIKHKSVVDVDCASYPVKIFSLVDADRGISLTRTYHGRDGEYQFLYTDGRFEFLCGMRLEFQTPPGWWEVGLGYALENNLSEKLRSELTDEIVRRLAWNIRDALAAYTWGDGSRQTNVNFDMKHSRRFRSVL